MGDLRFALTIIATMIVGYFNRDDAFEELLDRYNDEFPLEEEIASRLQACFDFINECGFPPSERIWRKADLFTLIVEIDQHFNEKGTRLQPSDVVERVQTFFHGINDNSVNNQNLSGIYYKAALQASNDRVNRIRRGIILSGIVEGKPEAEIYAELLTQGLISSLANQAAWQSA